MRDLTLIHTFYTGDAELALKTADLIAQFGRVNHYNAVVACPPETPYKSDIVRIYEDQFKEVEYLPIAHGVNGHPQAANMTFAQVANHMTNKGVPWYFFEGDCCPLHDRWLEDIAYEYWRARMSGSMVLGEKIEANHLYPNMCKVLIGSAVYPEDILADQPNVFTSPLIRGLEGYTRYYVARGVKPQNFDVYITNELWKYAADTKLMQTVNKVGGFELDGETIRFQPRFPTYKLEPVVRKEAAVFHGCIDGSIHEAVKKLRGLVPQEKDQEPEKEPSDPWDNVDWNKQNATIAREMSEATGKNVLPMHVGRMRKRRSK